MLKSNWSMLVRASAMLGVLTLGACSISGLLPDWTSPEVAGPEPAYRFIIANGLAAIVGSPSSAGTFEISGLRRVDSLKGASWLACLRTQSLPQLPNYYAVFLQKDRVVDSRLSVLIDQCELQTYSSFDWVADAKAPPVR
jgi:hypothetical protein